MSFISAGIKGQLSMDKEQLNKDEFYLNKNKGPAQYG